MAKTKKVEEKKAIAKTAKSKVKIEDYTVVGLYVDNGQTYVASIQATSVKEVVKKAKARMKKNNGDDGNNVLAVFRGEHMDVYGED